MPIVSPDAPPWATATDVISRWVGETPAPTEAVATTWIGDAETLIRFEYPDLQTRIDDVTVTLDRVVLVVARMVIRALRNPDNVRQQQTGPFGTTYAGDNPGGLYLSDDDRKLLGTSSGPTGAFSVDTVGTSLSIHAPWCALLMGATYCSCGAELTGSYPLYEV